MTTRDEMAWIIHRACGCNGDCRPDREDEEGADALIAAGYGKVDGADEMTARIAHQNKEIERQAGHIVALQTQCDLAESRAAHAEKQVSRLQWYASRGKVGMDASPDTEPSR